MAHVGQEVALRAGRLLGASLGDLELLDEMGKAGRVHLLRLPRRFDLPGIAAQLVLGSLAIGHVPRGRVDDLLLDRRACVPEEPPVRAVLAPVAVLVGNRLRAGRDLSRLGNRRRTVLRVDELEVRHREEFPSRVTQRPFPAKVQTLEVTVEPGDAQHVEREREESVALFLSLAARRDVAGHRQAQARQDVGDGVIFDHGRSPILAHHREFAASPLVGQKRLPRLLAALAV